MAYLTADEIEQGVAALAAHYSTWCERIELPNKSIEGRTISLLRIGLDRSGDRPGCLILGGVHAREWMPPDACLYLPADLLEAYELDKGLVYGGRRYSKDDIHTIMEQLDLFIIPCVNPDGRAFSQTANPMWRGNRHVETSGGKTSFGVDINRNFDFQQVYSGPRPGSEPESKNVAWALDSFTNIKYMVDVHSFGHLLLHNWGDDQNQSVDPQISFQNPHFDGKRGLGDDQIYREFIPAEDEISAKLLVGNVFTAIKEVRGSQYAPGSAFSLYPTSGTTDDYAYSRHFRDNSTSKVLGFTIECGKEFQPPFPEAEEVMREVAAGLIEFGLTVYREQSGGA